VRFLFAGRLHEEKGLKVLLEAVEKLTAANVRGVVDGRRRTEFER
jgi:hypothetical protein